MDEEYFFPKRIINFISKRREKDYSPITIKLISVSAPMELNHSIP